MLLLLVMVVAEIIIRRECFLVEVENIIVDATRNLIYLIHQTKNTFILAVFIKVFILKAALPHPLHRPGLHHHSRLQSSRDGMFH